MVIGTLTLTLHVPHSASLKDKRQVVRPLTSRLRTTFQVAVAEIDELNTWQTAVLGVACVSGDARHADAVCQKILRHVENEADAVLTHSRFELVHI